MTLGCYASVKAQCHMPRRACGSGQFLQRAHLPERHFNPGQFQGFHEIWECREGRWWDAPRKAPRSFSYGVTNDPCMMPSPPAEVRRQRISDAARAARRTKGLSDADATTQLKSGAKRSRRAAPQSARVRAANSNTDIANTHKGSQWSPVAHLLLSTPRKVTAHAAHVRLFGHTEPWNIIAATQCLQAPPSRQLRMPPCHDSCKDDQSFSARLPWIVRCTTGAEASTQLAHPAEVPMVQRHCPMLSVLQRRPLRCMSKTSRRQKSGSFSAA